MRSIEPVAWKMFEADRVSKLLELKEDLDLEGNVIERDMCRELNGEIREEFSRMSRKGKRKCNKD
jgi:hypothetical protein